MMTSDHTREAYVWIWLPGEAEPVVAGRLEFVHDKILFNYGKSYLERVSIRSSAIPIYEPELPLQPGRLQLPDNLTMPGCIRDAAPDAWGRRVIIRKVLGLQGPDTETAVLDELTYLLESGSDRIGALDFQRSPTEYVPRGVENVTMDELARSAECIEKGMPLPPDLDHALLHGSSIGGARPKALIQDQDGKYIAKFSSSTDYYSVVKIEFIAMRLAHLAGLDVAPVKLSKAANKDVLLVKRFDREPKDDAWSRRAMVSALTLFNMDEMEARYASYEDLAEIVRHRFTDPEETLKELFTRIAFNILCGNTDDHARNHAAFWDGKTLSLTPAYDVCPQPRTGGEASQAMKISGENNLSQLRTCLEAAHNFLLTDNDAQAIFDHLVETITQHWDAVCDEANLAEDEKKLFWGRQFLNPYALER